MRIMLRLHTGAFDKLQLVELHRQQRQLVYPGTLVQQHLPGLARQPEYEMRPGVYAPFSRHPDRLLRAGEIVTSVYMLQRQVIAGLDTIFQSYQGMRAQLAAPLRQRPSFLQIRQPVQQLPVHAIRPCAYHQTHHIRMFQRLHIKPLQFLHRGICVRICLKISEIMLCSPVSDLMEAYSFLYLCVYPFVRYAVARVEGVVVTIGAAAGAHRAVPVGAGEACVYH